MAIYPIFKGLGLGQIDRADSGWRTSQQQLAEVVRDFWFEGDVLLPEKAAPLAEKIYGSAEPGNIVRLARFNRLALSVRDGGYLCPLVGSVTREEDPQVWFPRLHYKNGNLMVNDGHHRIAVLSFLGVKVFPVVTVKIETRSISAGEVIKRYRSLSDQVCRTTPRFKASSEWADYQKTSDCLLWYKGEEV